jgi:hypothetical protein
MFSLELTCAAACERASADTAADAVAVDSKKARRESMVGPLQKTTTAGWMVEDYDPQTLL